MLISTKGRYAVRMLLDIAMTQQDGYVSMKDIAERQQISKKYLETFTAQLAAVGILGIRRGKSGGYRLLKDPGEITLLEVITAVEGSISAISCLECGPNACARASFCMTLSTWKGLDKVVKDYLTSVTLGKILAESGKQPFSTEEI